MTNTKLILVEGLPGSGKTTTAKLIEERLKAAGNKVRLFVEGDTEHPADFESVAFLTKEEFNGLLEDYPNWRDLFVKNATQKDDHFLLSYLDTKVEAGGAFPDTLFQTLASKDVYELPANKNRELITENWASFTKKAKQEDQITIFECAFIQNPLTLSMIKENREDAFSIEYVEELARISEPLDPVLVYVDQEDIEAAFKKALKERPKVWADAFLSYYTGQGYGQAHQLEGIEGTIHVLKARKRLEQALLKRLILKKVMMNNTSFDLESYTFQLDRQLKTVGLI